MKKILLKEPKMRILATWIVGVFLGWSASAAELPNAKNLAVEYQAEPLAVDVPAPGFSWEVSSPERGTRQSAYQILVAESPFDPAGAGNLFWDSGKVQSSENVAVPYSGPALKSRRRYFWKVRIWDQARRPGAESATASFVTGVLDPKDWIGKWVWEDDRVEPNDYAYFRATVDLAEAPTEAVAIVSAHNLFTLYVNGRRVSGYVNPGSSNPYRHKLYLAYSIAPFLKPGQNTIAASAYYKGEISGNYIKATPGFFFEAKIRGRDGKEVMVASGPDWKALADTPYDESAPFLTRRHHTGAEYFDARREPAGWTGPGFDDASWPRATVVDPKFQLRAQLMPESNLESLIRPTRVSRPWPGVYVFDLGREISGWARIEAAGPAGETVQVRYSDRRILGRVTRSAAEEPTLHYFDRYTFAGQGAEIWQPQFGYRAFRFMEVTGFPGRPGPDNIQGAFARTLIPTTAEFSSSNELLNRIYKISVHTQAMNMVGQLVDCVHREQSQWHADADLESGTVFYTFFDPQIVRKALVDLQDGQFEDGHLPANYPADLKWQSIIPEWDLHYLPMLWRTYFYYNDREILKECWPAVKKLMNFFEGWRDSTGLVKKSEAWHINDWTEDYAKMDASGKYLTVENCLYYDALLTAGRIAEILGEAEAAAHYRETAEAVKAAINRHLYDAVNHNYLDSYGSKEKHAAASALALQFGIVPESDRSAVLDYVKRQGFSASVVLTYNLLDMLYDFDQGDFAYSLINRTDWPGWGYMVRKGSSTTWESWHDWFSRSHAFNAYLARDLISGVVGIKPAAPGWKTIEVRPHPGGDLKWAKASLKTAAGPVSASWEKTGEGFSLALKIPGNTEARVGLPLPGGTVTSVYEGENLIWPQEGADPDPSVQFLGRDPGYLNFLVGSGEWNFRIK